MTCAEAFCIVGVTGFGVLHFHLAAERYRKISQRFGETDKHIAKLMTSIDFLEHAINKRLGSKK